MRCESHRVSYRKQPAAICTSTQQPHHGTIDNRSLCTATNPGPTATARKSLNISWGRAIKKESLAGFLPVLNCAIFYVLFFVVAAYEPTVHKWKDFMTSGYKYFICIKFEIYKNDISESERIREECASTRVCTIIRNTCSGATTRSAWFSASEYVLFRAERRLR